MLKAVLGRALLLTSLSVGAATAGPLRPDDFTLPPPAPGDAARPLTLWSTFYYAHPARPASGPGTMPLLLADGTQSPVRLTVRDWCLAGMEGTLVVADEGRALGFNYADHGGPRQADCRPFFSRSSQAVIDAMARNRFTPLPAGSPYGLGVASAGARYRLVPFRTVAVDPSVVPFGTTLFLPALRGLRFRDVDGVEKAHDGYVFAADRGGAIKGGHVDFFSGLQTSNPFPSLIQSRPTGTFAATVVGADGPRRRLASQHERDD